jgi:hypothetical protein
VLFRSAGGEAGQRDLVEDGAADPRGLQRLVLALPLMCIAWSARADECTVHYGNWETAARDITNTCPRKGGLGTRCKEKIAYADIVYRSILKYCKGRLDPDDEKMLHDNLRKNAAVVEKWRRKPSAGRARSGGGGGTCTVFYPHGVGGVPVYGSGCY